MYAFLLASPSFVAIDQSGSPYQKSRIYHPLLPLSYVLNSIFKLRGPRIQYINLSRSFIQFGLIMIIYHDMFERSIDHIFAGPKQFMIILRLAFQDTGKLLDISIININLRHKNTILNKMLFKTCSFLSAPLSEQNIQICHIKLR